MGAEEFEVALFSNASMQETEQMLESCRVRTVRPEYDIPGISYFVYEDDEHLIEIQLGRSSEELRI